VNTEIAVLARQMLREALRRGWKLKPLDSVHLATAKWGGAREFHTYDADLFKYEEVIGCARPGCHVPVRCAAQSWP